MSKKKGLLVADESSVSRAGGDDPRSPTLNRTRILRAALRLIDTQGLSALTMRALATELAVSPMALYNYVSDKEELLDLTLDLMLGEVDCSATDG
ncbi:MAG: TetR/AcrR family transcriptional regulator, partial [Actinobacteria bacterium]|nr:TetR/AcrR family transcriptional regulator [Actinomycetota bacterium]